MKIGLKTLTALTILIATTATAMAQTAVCPLAPIDDGRTPFFHIAANGKITVHAAKIMQTVGTSFYARAIWGESFIRIILKTNDKTKITKRFGETIPVTEIKAGDIVSFEGQFENGDVHILTTAAWLKDWSIQTASGAITGSITSVDPGTQTFILATADRGNLTVKIGTGDIRKGTRTIAFDEIKTGDRVTSATGVYNAADKSFAADTVQIYIDPAIFYPRNFNGVLKTKAGDKPPTELTVTAEGKEYTLQLGTATIILNYLRQPLSLSRFVAGDNIRFYGAIQELTPNIIKIEVLRNLDL